MSVNGIRVETSAEYTKLEKKIAEIDVKLNSIFNRIIGAVFSLTIASSILVVGSISLLNLSIITIAMTGNPIQALLIKGTLIFGACFGVFTITILSLIILKSNEIIKSNPL